MREQLIVEGKEAEDCDLIKLAAKLKTGQKISGYYRYFLFGNKPCNLSFELKRVSERLAIMHHLDKKHEIRISA